MHYACERLKCTGECATVHYVCERLKRVLLCTMYVGG